MKICFQILLIILSIHFSQNGMNKIKYVALGDSYTICEGADYKESWPKLLAEHLDKNGIETELIANPSRTGWTTKDLIENELPIYEKSNPTFATLLIGVNDWVQGVDAETFHRNLNFILDKMLLYLPNKKNLLLITIPDFGVTPSGSKYGNGRNISEGISEFNRIIISEAQKRNLKVVDIFPVSQKMKDDPALIANDGLHPSAREYAIWENLIYPVAYDLLKAK